MSIEIFDSHVHVPRRGFLKALAMTGAGAVLPPSLLSQEKVNRLTARGGAIDVHHHYRPPLEGAVGNPKWSAQMSLDQMDKFGIAVSLLSMTQLREQLYDGTEKGRKLMRFCNDFAAKLMQDHPTRFGLLAGIPLADVDGSLKEIEYSYDTLNADGIGIYSSTGDRWPGDPMFDPIFQELNRRKAIVLIHPATPNCCKGLATGVPESMIEYDFDLTRAAASLVAGGVLHKYPDVRFILVHSGGALPVFAGRMRSRYPKDAKHAEFIPNGMISELQKFYFEVAHATFKYPLAALLAFADPSHILFGTDYSPEAIETTVNELPTSGLTQAQLQAIERGNAERLFSRFKA